MHPENDACALIPLDFSESSWSAAFYELLEIDQNLEQLNMKLLQDSICPADARLFRENWQQLLDGNVYEKEQILDLKTTGGSIKKCIFNYCKYGDIGESGVVVLQVSDAAHLSAQIRKLREDLEQIKEENPHQLTEDIEGDPHIIQKVSKYAGIGWWEHDKQKNITVACGEIYDLLGMDASLPFDAEKFKSKIHPRDRKMMDGLVAEVSPENNVVQADARVIHDDGNELWVNFKIEFTFIDNDLIKSFGIIQDISQQKITEHHLKRVQEIAGVGWYEVDHVHAPASRASEEFLKIHGYTQESVEGPDLEEFVSRLYPEDREKFDIFKQIDDPTFISWEDLRYRVILPDDSTRHILCYGEVIRNQATGAPLKTIGVTVDISPLVETKELLRLVQRKAKVGWMLIDFGSPENTQITDEFLYMHGLNTKEEATKLESLIQNVHSTDREQLISLAESIRDTTTLSWKRIRYRVFTEEGDIRHIIMRGDVQLSATTQEIQKILVIARDNSENMENELYLEQAQQIARLGWFEVDVKNRNRSKCSHEFLKIYGLEHLNHYPSPEELDAVMYPEDLHLINQIRSDINQFPDGQSMIFRILTDGNIKYIQSTNRNIYGPDGQLLKITGTVQDITEITHVYEKLKQAQSISNTGWFEYNIDEPRKSKFSEEWLSMHDFHISEVPTESAYINRLHPKEREQIPTIRSFISNMPAQWDKLEFRIITREGDIRYISNSSRIEYRNDRPVKIFGVTTDVTDIRQAQKELFKSERRYRLLSETSRDVIFLLDGEPGKTTIAYVSDSVKSMMGYEKEEILGTRTLDFMHPEDAESYIQTYKPILQEPDRVVKMIFRLLKKSRDYIWAEALVNRFEDGQSSKVRLSVRDITDRKAVEDELVRTNNDLMALIKATDNMVFIINDELIFDAVIAKDEKQLHVPPSEFFNKPVREIWSDDNGIKMTELVEKSFADNQSYSFEYPFTLKGKFNWYRASIHPYEGFDGKTRVCVVIEIITLQKKAEEDLKKSIEMERELSTMRTNFVSMTSHQFRTPLTVIKSNMQLLEAANIDHPIAQKVSKRLVREVDRLVSLMEDILILGKVQSNNIRMEVKEIDLVALLKDISKDMNESLADGRVLDMKVCGIGVPFYGDPSLMRHAILNLISNAFKYSEGGPSPQVTLDFNFDDHISLVVKDFGIGISKDDQKRIFNDFFRGSNVSHIQGTGLGLSITREFLHLNHCEISFRSKPNLGTTFMIILPKNP